MWEVVVAGGFLIAVTFLFLRFRNRAPYLVVGWLWYRGTLVPVTGLVQIGMQAVADRYTYIPLIGLFIIIVWGVGDLLARFQSRRIIIPVSVGLLILILSIVTRLQVSRWESSISLLQYTLSVTTNNPLVDNNLGVALDRQGKAQEATAHFAEALRWDPNYVDAYKNLGAALARQGRVQEALVNYEKVLKIRPDDAEVHYRMGFLMARQGKEEESLQQYREALRIQPSHADAHNKWSFPSGIPAVL